MALANIETLLLQNGMTLQQIPNMPFPDYSYIQESCNMLIQEELNYENDEMRQQHETFLEMMTDEQRNVHDTIMAAIEQNEGGVFFLYGYGGTGKTFVWRTLSEGIRSQGEIVINTASSGIAALLIPGGRTAHSRFKIPIDLHEDSYCSITPDSDLAALLKKAKLIIWDEAPMMHRHCFEALDRTLKDILQNPNKPFGGKVIVFGGDFRQVLPVIQKGNRADIVNASINHSKIWDTCKVLRLTVNMRLKSGKNEEENKQTKSFADWILKIGEGTLGGENDGEVEIEFPNDVLIQSSGNHEKAMLSAIYPSIDKNKNKKGFFQDKAILVPTNEEVDSINEFALSQIIDEDHTFYSSDTICETEITDTFERSLYSPEILNAFKIPGIPNHKLSLKKNVPVMLLRNIDQSNGLCNGTRLLIKRMATHVIEAEIISGSHIGNKTYIPRMRLMPTDKRIPFRFNRRQFPIGLSFAMTINKSQGQSLSNVGLFLRKPVFTHGQLYVAVSRVTTKSGLKVLICNKELASKNKTTNVVYHEVLQKI